jgi:hypothetical protein
MSYGDDAKGLASCKGERREIGEEGLEVWRQKGFDVAHCTGDEMRPILHSYVDTVHGFEFWG